VSRIINSRIFDKYTLEKFKAVSGLFDILKMPLPPALPQLKELLCTKRAEVRKCWVHRIQGPSRSPFWHSKSPTSILRLPLKQLSNQHVTLCDIIELEDDAPKRQKPATTFALCKRQSNASSSSLLATNLTGKSQSSCGFCFGPGYIR